MSDILENKIRGIDKFVDIPQLEVTAYRHPAWTTIVYKIPRAALKAPIRIAELNGNSIYFLQSKDVMMMTKALYVGQASIRNNGKTSLARIHEHESDGLKDAWNYAYVFTSIFQDENGWNPTILNILENHFKLYIENNLNCECLNSNTPNIGSVPGPELEEIISNMKAYLYKLMPDVFEQEVDQAEETSLIEEKEISLFVNDLQDDVFGTRDITTPEPTVKAMVDMLPQELFNSRTKFLDPACKAGEFLYEIYTRLMSCEDLETRYKDPIKRSMHILEDQLFGIAISENSYNTTTELLYGDHKRRNIRRLEDYEYKIKEAFSKGYRQGIAKSRDLIFNTIFRDIFNTTGQENTQEMRFDVVIGNPPYSDSETRGTTGSGNALYPQFMAMASALGTYSSLIVPSGWMINYPVGVKHEVVDELRKNEHIKELYDFEDATKIFKGVTIPAGVCYYLVDNTKGYKGECKRQITCINGDTVCLEHDTMYEDDMGIILRSSMAVIIKEKIRNNSKVKFKSFADTCVSGRHHFDDGAYVMETTWAEYSSVKTNDFNILYYLKANNKAHRYSCMNVTDSDMPNLGFAYVSKDQIPRNVEDYKRHKIIVGRAFTAGSNQVMDIPYYIGNNSCCSQSFIPIFSPNNTEEECLNICKYIKTRFFRYLVSILKTGQNLANSAYKLVPTQDFTPNSDIDWSQSVYNIERQLYEKYSLSKEEIDYIEKTIKDMK